MLYLMYLLLLEEVYSEKSDPIRPTMVIFEKFDLLAVACSDLTCWRSIESFEDVFRFDLSPRVSAFTYLPLPNSSWSCFER